MFSWDLETVNVEDSEQELQELYMHTPMVPTICPAEETEVLEALEAQGLTQLLKHLNMENISFGLLSSLPHWKLQYGEVIATGWPHSIERF